MTSDSTARLKRHRDNLYLTNSFHPRKDQIYAWTYSVHDGIPVIRETIYPDIPTPRFRRYVSKSYKKFKIPINNELRCFISGMKLVVAPSQLLQDKVSNIRYTTWFASAEHLMATKIYPDGVNDHANIVPCGKYLNEKLGHESVSFKLMLRRELKKLDYDREDVLNNSDQMTTIINEMIRLSDSIREIVGGEYWHYWAYEGTDKHQIALDYHERLKKLDFELIMDKPKNMSMAEYTDQVENDLPMEKLM